MSPTTNNQEVDRTIAFNEQMQEYLMDMQVKDGQETEIRDYVVDKLLDDEIDFWKSKHD